MSIDPVNSVDLPRLLRVAQYQRALVFCLGAGFALFVVAFVVAFVFEVPPRTVAILSLAIGLTNVTLTLLLGRLLFPWRELAGLAAVAVAPLSSVFFGAQFVRFAPLVSMVVLLGLNQRANAALRSAGFQVGLFGGDSFDVWAAMRGERPVPLTPAFGPDPSGWWLVAPPAVAALLLLFIPFFGIAVTLVVITICVVVYWVNRDSRELGHAHPAWLFGMVLLPVALPLYTDARRHWGGSLRWPFAIAGVLALGAAFWFHGDVLRKLVPPAKVTVSCRLRSDVPRDGYICKTEHVGGYEDARACWDLTADCDDGTKITEHACSHAVVRETREGIVPFEYSEGIESCTAITGAVVEHLQVVLPDGDALQPVTR